MKKEIEFLSGPEGVDANFKRLAKILRRFSKRLQRTVVTVYPPVLINGYANTADDNGFLFAYVAAYKGNIKDITVAGVVTGDDPVVIRLAHKSSRDIDYFDRSLEKSVRRIVFNKDINVEAGDVLIFSTTQGERLSEVTMFGSYILGKGGYPMEELVIDELETQGDEVIESVLAEEE